VEAFLPQVKVDIFSQYTQTVTNLIKGSAQKVIVIDVGGGKHCPFAGVDDGDTTIVAMDISEGDLRQNGDVNGRLVADIMGGLPFRSRTVDVITSRSVLEHVEDVTSFVEHASSVLKLGGYWVHLFPSKFSPFALINQLLPRNVSRAAVYFFRPGSKGVLGFPAFYDKCYYSAMRNLLLNNGFELVDVKASYYQSQYFDFCLPLFAASAIYEVLVELLGLRNLAAYILVVARRARV